MRICRSASSVVVSVLLTPLVFKQELATQKATRIVGHALQEVLERLALFLGRIVFFDGRRRLAVLRGFHAGSERLVDRLGQRLLLLVARLALGRFHLGLWLGRRALRTLRGLLFVLLLAGLLLRIALLFLVVGVLVRIRTLALVLLLLIRFRVARLFLVLILILLRFVLLRLFLIFRVARLRFLILRRLVLRFLLPLEPFFDRGLVRLRVIHIRRDFQCAIVRGERFVETAKFGERVAFVVCAVGAADVRVIGRCRGIVTGTERCAA